MALSTPPAVIQGIHRDVCSLRRHRRTVDDGQGRKDQVYPHEHHGQDKGVYDYEQGSQFEVMSGYVPSDALTDSFG